MSHSSGATLTSPTTIIHMTSNDHQETSNGAGTAAETSTQSRPSTKQRTSSHGANHASNAGHHAHHSHGHGHGHGHAHGHTRRRPSGHSAHGASGAGNGHANPRRGSDSESGRKVVFAGLTMQTMDGDAKKNKARPPGKTSRSDTNLPRLSRTTSEHSNDSQGRPKPKHKDSGDSAILLDEKGREVGEVEDEDGDWEEEESSKEKRVLTAQDMRRTMSDNVTETRTQSPEQMENRPASIHSPVTTKRAAQPPPSLLTRKTTGFAGAVSTPDPSALPPVVHNETIIEATRDLKRTPSSKELAIEAVQGERRKITGGTWGMTPAEPPQPRTPVAHSPPNPRRPDAIHMRSTEGSALPANVGGNGDGPETSPAFPFPKVTLPPDGTTSTAEPRARTTSGPGLRHRYSNSSLRSIQSLRAPPHPLNSPSGYRGRTGGSALNSPTRSGRSLHQPPLAAPVIYREVAQGIGYDEPAGEMTKVKRPVRQPSISSQHNLRTVFAPTSTKGDSSPSSSTVSSGPSNYRRKTATELASAAARLQTTNDPALYHQSLGYSTASAETTHLISRFLPPKRVERPKWEITAEQVREGQVNTDVGLTDGDYREAHESLVRTMREMGLSQGTKRIGRNASQATLVNGPSSAAMGGPEESLSVLKGRKGTLMVARGGWKGKTPFELGLERVMAQRPQKPLGY